MSTEKPSEKSFHSIDKTIDCTPKVKDVKTQYSLSHCYHSISKKPAVKPTFVKIPPKRKTREASVNTDISFAPQENVIMETVSENISTESYYETDIEKNESDSDPDYYPSSDGSESKIFILSFWKRQEKQDLSQMEQYCGILVLSDSTSTEMFYLSVPSYYRKKFC